MYYLVQLLPLVRNIFFKNSENNNHNLIKKVRAITFFQGTILQCILKNADIRINI